MPSIIVLAYSFHTISLAVCWQEMQQKGTRPCAARWTQMDGEMMRQRIAGRAAATYQMLKSLVNPRGNVYLSSCPCRCHVCGELDVVLHGDACCAEHPSCWLIPLLAGLMGAITPNSMWLRVEPRAKRVLPSGLPGCIVRDVTC